MTVSRTCTPHITHWADAFAKLLAVRSIAWLALLITGPAAPNSHNGIDMPISLAKGVVRTPEFSAKRGFYNIHVEVQWLLPTDELRCKMGFAVSPSDDHCKWAPLLNLEWKVLDGSTTVAEGIDSGRSTSFEADRDTLSRSVGSFKALARHRYVVELRVLSDSAALDVAKPRLIVEQPGFSF